MTERITDHYDGHGLNELCVIEKDEPGPGGASHEYKLWRMLTQEDADALEADQGDEKARFTPVVLLPEGHALLAGRVQFQKGPRNEPGSTPGIVEAALVAVLIDRLCAFQAGPYACRENALALTKCEEALHWMKHRADARAKRGVLGTVKT